MARLHHCRRLREVREGDVVPRSMPVCRHQIRQARACAHGANRTSRPERPWKLVEELRAHRREVHVRCGRVHMHLSHGDEAVGTPCAP